MKKHTFVKGASMLVGAALLAKFIGAIYRIPLTNIIGAEGIGMYQLVFPVYSLLLTLTSGGVGVAVSKITAENRTLLQKNDHTLAASFILLSILSVTGAVLLAVFSNRIAIVQGNSAVRDCYLLIAPSVILVAYSAMIKGWFQGNFNMIPTAVSGVIEQIVKLGVGLLLAKYLLPRGLIYAVFGAVAAVTIAEMVSLLFLGTVFILNRKNYTGLYGESKLKDGLLKVSKTSFPIMAANLMLPLSYFLDSIIVINILKYTGYDTALSTAQYGLYSGTVMSLVNMPVVLILALSVAVVPAVAAEKADRDLDGIVKKCATSIKLSYVVGIPASLLLFALAEPIIELLYPALTVSQREMSVNLLQVAAFSVVFLAQMQIYGSILQALGKTGLFVGNTAVGVAVKTIITTIAVFYFGILGAAAALVAMGAVTTALNIFALNKLVGKKLKLVKNISEIMVGGVIITTIALLVQRFVDKNIAVLVIAFFGCGTVYVILLAVLKVFEKGELDGVPFYASLKKLGALFGSDR